MGSHSDYLEQGPTTNVGGYQFALMAEIRPDRDPITGAVSEYDPVASSACTRHPDGHGPFCRFRLPGLPPRGGVYALTFGNGALAYAGKTGNLVERFGSRGYGVIYERNCLPDGPRTTCYINTQILICARAGESVHLWFYEEPRDLRTAIEEELIRRFDPPWNRSGRSARVSETTMNKLVLEEVWGRIEAYQGEEFHTKTGEPFTFEISGYVFRPSRTEYNVSRSDFGKALELVPFDGPGGVNRMVRGPAYVWAVLHDPRIRQQDW